MQIEGERRSALELILVVLLLGLLLNCVASAVYDRFAQNDQEQILLWISILGSVVIIVVFVLAGLLRPIKLHTEVPVVLFFDTSAGTISVPTQIHYPGAKHSGIEFGPESLIPFPILCRLYFDEYKKRSEVTRSEMADVTVQQDTLASLIHYTVIDHYTKEHDLTWGPMHRTSIGPFLDSGYGRNLPSAVYDRTELAVCSQNKFLEMHASGPLMKLPDKSKVQFPSPNVLVLSSPLYRAEIRIVPSASQHMQSWEFARGTVSSWYRELSSDFSSTYAHLLELRMEFTLKVGFWRFFAEDWLPRRFRPGIAIQDICEWVNSWIATVSRFFIWVDEDLSILPDSEMAMLVNESTLAYQPKLRTAPLIVFGDRLSPSTQHKDALEKSTDESDVKQ